MRSLLALLFLSLALRAEPESVRAIRVVGAKRILASLRADADQIAKRHANGVATEGEVQALARRVLDAERDLLEAEAPEDLATRRLALLEKIELFEARRFAAAQKLAEAGALAATGLIDRRVAHQHAWIEHNHYKELARTPGRAAWLGAERDRQRAKTSLQAARERLDAARKAGGAVGDLGRAVIRFETDLAVAQERLKLAEK